MSLLHLETHRSKTLTNSGALVFEAHDDFDGQQGPFWSRPVRLRSHERIIFCRHTRDWQVRSVIRENRFESVWT